MTTQTEQQIASLHAAVQRIEEMAERIRQSLANDDPAEAEVVLAELTDTASAVAEALAQLEPRDEPPEVAGDRETS